MSPLRSLLLGALALHAGVTAEINNQVPLTNLDDYTCTHPPYKVTLVSKSPLVIYITDFLTPSERAHLLHITSNTFTPSAISPASHSGRSPSHIRTSHSTLVPRDPLIRCLETRALLFQGPSTPRGNLEPLQLVRYLPSQRYHYHTDWFPSPPPYSEGGNRVSSFFAYVRVANGTTGGGTNFPRLEGVDSEAWCRSGVVDCDGEWEGGVTFRAVEGNAVFWENLGAADGGGDERTMHAGLPLVEGEKVGMNIWTREGSLGEGVRGGDTYED